MKHYVYGSGEHGCLYDNGPHLAASAQDAAESLAFTFEKSEAWAKRLAHELYVELDPRKDGASYAEISECSCSDPSEHCDCGGRDRTCFCRELAEPDDEEDA